MAENQPTPGQTLAVLLGASDYRYARKLARGPAFYNSSQQFAEYLSVVMKLPDENIASFFDEGRSAGDQLREIRDFLEQRSAELKNAGTAPRDLIVHYVGHGLFCGGDNDYCLAIRSTDEQSEAFTSIRMRDLADVIRKSATFLRKYLILDCCFSGAAYAELQSGPLNVMQVKIRDMLDDSPQRGTTLLCSASARDPSVAPKGLSRTMFSDSLLAVLREGHESYGPQLSFSDVGDLVRHRIKETHREVGVRPEVHSPDQRSGDVSRVPLFPNPAWGGEGVSSTSQQERAQAGRTLAAQDAERRAAEQKAAEQKAEEQKAAEKRVYEQRAAEQRAAERNAAEQRAAELKAAEQKAAEQRVFEQQAAEQRAAELKEAERRALEDLLSGVTRIEIVFPEMGEAILEGTIIKWLKQVGDQVEQDEALFEISTDKVDAEIPAPATGVLSEIKVPEGATIPVNTVVGVLHQRAIPDRRAPKDSRPRAAVATLEILMPQMGESILEGTIVKWLKQAGDRVEYDEPLFEISTDKVDAEIPAPATGVLSEIKVPEGSTVPVNTVVAVMLPNH